MANQADRGGVPTVSLKEVASEIRLSLRVRGPHIQLHRSTLELWLAALQGSGASPQEELEKRVIDQVRDHWFIQGGKMQFGEIPECNNADEIVSAILTAVRRLHPPEGSGATTEKPVNADLKYTADHTIPCAACSGIILAGAQCYRDARPDTFRHLLHGPLPVSALRASEGEAKP